MQLVLMKKLPDFQDFLPKKIMILSYVVNGLFVGLASIVLMSRIASGQPAAGEGYEMDVITACVVGGIASQEARERCWESYKRPSHGSAEQWPGCKGCGLLYTAVV